MVSYGTVLLLVNVCTISFISKKYQKEQMIVLFIRNGTSINIKNAL